LPSFQMEGKVDTGNNRLAASRHSGVPFIEEWRTEDRRKSLFRPSI
jgi:hypothetical protein